MDNCIENVIEFLMNQDQATVTFSQGRYKNRIRKLTEERPTECEIVAENKDGSMCAHIPVSWVRIAPPKHLTEEQRAEMGARLQRKQREIACTQA